MIAGKGEFNWQWPETTAETADKLIERIQSEGKFIPGTYQIRRISPGGAAETLIEFEKTLVAERTFNTKDESAQIKAELEEPLNIEIIDEKSKGGNDFDDFSDDDSAAIETKQSSVTLLAGTFLADRLRRKLRRVRSVPRREI